MFLTDRKLERRIEEIEQYRYRDIIELKSFHYLIFLQSLLYNIFIELSDNSQYI